jgi:hypothetical protein
MDGMEFQVVFVHSRGKLKNVATMIQWKDWTEWNGWNGIPSFHFHCSFFFFPLIGRKPRGLLGFHWSGKFCGGYNENGK